jgi:predicted AAA+ superfamily ATPase
VQSKIHSCNSRKIHANHKNKFTQFIKFSYRNSQNTKQVSRKITQAKMKAYKKRIVDAAISEALEVFGALVIEGARAVGKSTSARQISASGVSLDSSPELAALAQTSPGAVLPGKVPRLIDEWQLAPAVWNAVRHEVDQRGRPGQFILTGSATPTDDITRHSGAGRFGRIRLRTMSLAETGDSTKQVNFRSLFSANAKKIAAFGGPDIPGFARLITKGGWPFLAGMTEKKASLWLQGYLEDTARLDIDGRGDRERVKALMRALARNLSTETAISNLMNESQIENTGAPSNTSVSTPTVRKYLDALTRVFVLEELPPWSARIRSKVRQRTSPKWHFVDPSLAAAALGVNADKLLSEPRTLGLFFESLAIRDLRIYAGALGGTVSYYRDETGLEVDAIAELPNRKCAAFEIKLGGESRIAEGAANLKKLRGKLEETRRRDLKSLNIITAGNTSRTRDDGVNIIGLGHMTLA